jgi:hypothetical protein
MLLPRALVVVSSLLLATTLAACATDERPQAGRTPSTRTSVTPSVTSSPTPSPTVSPSRAPVTRRQARHAWDAALLRLGRARTGQYSWALYVDGASDPLSRESGAYSIDPMKSAFERTFSNPSPGPGERAEYVAKLRRIAGVTYMQMEDWGSWNGCWLKMTSDLIEDQTSIDVSGGPDLPVGVAVMADSTVVRPSGSWFGDPYVEYTAQVTAVEALQFLGVSARQFPRRLDDLASVKAPMVVTIGVDDRPYGGAVRGADVAAAIRHAGVHLGADLRRYLPSLSASIVLRAYERPVTIAVPSPARILPADAVKTDTCPANR